MSPDRFLQAVQPYVPSMFALIAIFGSLLLLDRFIRRRNDEQVIHDHLRQQLLQAGLWALGAVGIILALPISESTKGQLLTLSGILGSAVIGLASTSFVGNAMAGLMLKALGNFRPGDYLRVGEHFGRISDRGLFHTEIQTEDRRLTSLPNLYLATNPIEVVPASGAIVACSVSLGYDISRTRIEKALVQATEDTGLKDGFVQIRELGDHSVTYRVAGVLSNVRSLISSHSRLRACMLDSLHAAQIEVVSPAFENQRTFASDRSFISDPDDVHEVPARLTMEEIVFDKADLAETIGRLNAKLSQLEQELEELKAKLVVEDDPEVIAGLESRLSRKEELVTICRRTIQEREKDRIKV